MKKVQNCFEWNLKLCTFENIASVLAAVYVLLGRAVTEYRWGGSRNIPFMRNKCIVLTVEKLLKSVYIYGSYREIKTGVSLFWTTLYIAARGEKHGIMTNSYLFSLSIDLRKFNKVFVVGHGWETCMDGAAHCQTAGMFNRSSYSTKYLLGCAPLECCPSCQRLPDTFQMQSPVSFRWQMQHRYVIGKTLVLHTAGVLMCSNVT